jgi:hypothetical protein
MSDLKIVRHGTHFTIGVKHLESATVISVFGLPIGWEMTGIDANINRVVPEDWRTVIFDFSKTDFADSSLLRVVRTYWEETEADQSRTVFIVAEPETTLHEKLVLTGISRRVPVLPSLEEALGGR